MINECGTRLWTQSRSTNTCREQIEACTETRYEVVTSQSEWPQNKNILPLLDGLILNYTKNLSDFNFLPKDLLLTKGELSSVPLYNLVDILRFPKKEYINISYIRYYVKDILEKSVDESDLYTDNTSRK